MYSAILALVLCVQCVVDAAKLRPWLHASISLMDGDPPSARLGHGFTRAEDGKFYLFGGQDGNGDIDDDIQQRNNITDMNL
jgi:hypothetical protein